MDQGMQRLDYIKHKSYCLPPTYPPSLPPSLLHAADLSGLGQTRRGGWSKTRGRRSKTSGRPMTGCLGGITERRERRGARLEGGADSG